MEFHDFRGFPDSRIEFHNVSYNFNVSQKKLYDFHDFHISLMELQDFRDFRDSRIEF